MRIMRSLTRRRPDLECRRRDLRSTVAAVVARNARRSEVSVSYRRPVRVGSRLRRGRIADWAFRWFRRAADPVGAELRHDDLTQCWRPNDLHFGHSRDSAAGRHARHHWFVYSNRGSDASAVSDQLHRPSSGRGRSSLRIASQLDRAGITDQPLQHHLLHYRGADLFVPVRCNYGHEQRLSGARLVLSTGNGSLCFKELSASP